MKRVAVPVLAALTAVGLLGTLQLIFYGTPLDKLLYFNQKIFYWHVPFAMMLFATVFVCGVASGFYLARRNPRHDDVARAAGELAVLFGAVVLVSGMIWGKAAWGHWWKWELRLTTSLILWLTLVGYVLVRRFGGAGAERLAAGLAVFGMVNVPLVYFAVKLADQLGQASNHPKAEVVTSLAASMKSTYWLSVLAIALLYVLLLVIRTGAVRLERQVRELRERGLDGGVFEP